MLTMKIETLRVGMLQTNCYILITDEKILIIDPGGDSEKIIEFVEKNKKEKTEIIILNTHYHYDHTLANEELKKHFNAKILIHEYEKNFVEFKPDEYLKEDDEIQIGVEKLKVIHTPGHTKGGICLLGENIVFVGDTIFEQGVGRTDFPGGNMEELEESLEKISKILKKGMVVYPGHGNKFTWEE